MIAIAQTYDTEINGICYKIDGNVAKVTPFSENEDWNANHYQGEIIIPDEITYRSKKYPVTTIGQKSFALCYNITSVDLPNSITTIENEAFKGASTINRFHIGSSVSVIEKDAFYNATISQLDIDPTNQWFVAEDRVLYSADHKRAIVLIADYTERNTIDLVLHDNVEIIENGFNHGIRLKSLHIGNAVKWIGDYAFNHALAETTDQTDLILPDCIEHIGKYAFEMCIRVENLHLPDALTRLEEYSFSYVAPETIHMPKNLKVICDGALSCTAGGVYRNIILPEGLDSIGKYGITCIDCDSLIVPASVRYLSYNSLENTSRYIEIKAPLDSIAKSAMPSQRVKELVLPKTLKRLEAHAFYPCYNLERIVWPDSLEYIGAYALAGNKINPMVVPATVKTLDLGAFSDNVWQPHTYYLTSPEPPVCLRPDVFEYIMYEESTLYVPKGSREAYADKAPWSWFGKLEEYDEIVLPPATYHYDFTTEGIYYKVVSEDERTCEVSYDLNYITERNLYNYKEVIIPEVVTFEGKSYTVIGIEPMAFSETPLEHISLPQTMTYLDGAFTDCHELESIEIPENVTSIGGTFSHCPKIKAIHLPDKIENICSAFIDCSALEEINIPISVTQLDGAFQGCINLQSSIVLPNHITEIKERTFWGCSKLSSVVLPSELIMIEEMAFSSCTSLKSITLPEHLYIIKTAAFEGCDALVDIFSLNPEPPYPVGYSQFSNWNATVHVPTGSKNAYQAIDMWQYFNIVEDATAIEQLRTDPTIENDIDLLGRPIDKNYQGLIIRNGKILIKN